MEIEHSTSKLNMVPKCVTKWLKYYVIFPKPVSFIFGMILVNAWVEYALVALLITHLTDDLLHLPKAASIVNVKDGTTAILVLLLAYASDAYLGPFMAVVCTTVAYVSGLWLFYIVASFPQSTQIKLLYVGVMFVALGRAGRIVQLKEFLADQVRAEGSCEDEEQVESRRKVWWRSAYILGIAASVLFTNASWIQLCMISAIALATALGLFLLGSAFYEYKKPTDQSRLSKMLRVFYAAILKRHLNNTSSHNNHISHTSKLWWLDKAAILESSPSVEEQLSKGRLCTVEQVEEVKLLLTMFPLWTTFLVYGLLQATGNTLFFEQSGYTDNHLGHISQVPPIIFVIIRSSTRFIVSWLCDLLFPCYWGEKTPRRVMLVRIGVGMAISPICCIVAWRVEAYRLQRYVDHNISISFVWLIPQFFLLGLMEGLVFEGMEEIYSAVVPLSLNKYGPSFTEFALNIGHFLSLIFILIYHNLFSDDLNMSKLGVYYRKLAYVCFANLLIYCYVATYYVKQDSCGAPEEEQLQSMENGPESTS